MKISSVTKIVAALALVAPGLAMADATFSTGSGSLTAPAHIDFQITIRRCCFLALAP